MYKDVFRDSTPDSFFYQFLLLPELFYQDLAHHVASLAYLGI